MSAQEKEKLYDAIGYDEKKIDVQLPTDVCITHKYLFLLTYEYCIRSKQYIYYNIIIYNLILIIVMLYNYIFKISDINI